jgi:hypothetical protein
LRYVAKNDTLATNPTAVRNNLRYLKLRFHGIKVAPADDTQVAELATLFDKAIKGAAAGKSITQDHVFEGWRAVCVALLTAPEFHLY